MENTDVCYVFPRWTGTWPPILCGRLEHHRTNFAVRQPKILETFARLWGTDDLIASFDGINISQPINKETGRTDVKPTDAWPRKTHCPNGTSRIL